VDTLASVAMSAESTSLYRRHRPGSFEEVVGQQHVVRTLRNAVEQDKVHHAYLFVGSRGTGKTSMAKILARSLNCERGGPTVTPCGECESCVTIAAGTSIDVIEMDAASNRSVDDVRDLRERVAYAPAGGRWKVYILDEAHMLTKEAWNAFLKTLEEPPPNTVFVLATTESHKVMATIADRCQRFDFQRPSLEQISEVLRHVAKEEKIEIDDGAVAMIARSASGSFRDALGTLDQARSFRAFEGKGTFEAESEGTEGWDLVKLEDVLELLGAADAELLFEAVDAVIAEDPKGVLLGVEKMARSGRDPSQFARDLLAHLRHLLVTQTTGEVPTSFVVTATDSGRIEAQAASIRAAMLVRTIDELANALTAVREGDDARMAVEIALLKAARPDLDPSTEGLLRRIERLEGRLTEGGQAAGPVGGASPTVLGGKAASPPRGTPAPPPPAADMAPQDDPPPAEEEEAEPLPPEPPVAEEDAGPTAAVSDLDLDGLKRVWPAVLQKLAETAPALAATFEGAHPVAFDAEGLQIGFPKDKTFNKRKAEGAERREAVTAAFEGVVGQALKPTYVLLERESAEAEPSAETEDDAGIDEDAVLEKLKSEFDAEEVG
jgi:DNA polymerase III subunit gamma/tau